jgi:hypothetical protein
MSKVRQRRELRDAYRFPGFKPSAGVNGVFGDRMAIVIKLTRRRKKQRAACAVDGIGAITTSEFDVFAICRAATSGCTWNWRCDESRVAAAAR